LYFGKPGGIEAPKKSDWIHSPVKTHLLLLLVRLYEIHFGAGGKFAAV
jgi:hypothetical protein